MKNHYQKHLTLSDRTYIEQELQQGSRFSSIAYALDKDPATISKEVKCHRDYLKPDRFLGKCRSCMPYDECTQRHIYVQLKNNILCANGYRVVLHSILHQFSSFLLSAS